MFYGPATFFLIGLYLFTMIVVGYVASRFRKSESLSEFYLANRTLGPVVLLLTLYATQYSGNTLLGIPGEAYRVGYSWVMSVGFMMSVVVVYLLFAPRLYRLARKHNFVTPGDWVGYRFGSRPLTLLASLFYVIAITNYLLAQLTAMGHVVAGLSGGQLPFWVGVVVLGIVILVYETLGGMRAVAWTDCVQGLLLCAGLLGILVLVLPSLEGLHGVTEWILQHEPAKAAVPGGSVVRTWFSTLILVGFGAAVYPQSLQRIFAAKNNSSLRRSLSVMIFLPFVTVLPVMFIGILGISQMSNMTNVQSDQVMPQLLRTWAATSPWLYCLALLVLCGTVAAIMSTADSVLLSLSSILANDVLAKTRLSNASQATLTKVGKYTSWVVMAILMVLASNPKLTLWKLIELKMELLLQVSPLFILGGIWSRMTTRGAVSGMMIGTAVTISLSLWWDRKIYGVHTGVVGFFVNVFICVVASLLWNRPTKPARIQKTPETEIEQAKGSHHENRHACEVC